MKAVQKVAVAKQVKLDEESLQRLKEAEGKDKVGADCLNTIHTSFTQVNLNTTFLLGEVTKKVSGNSGL